MLQDLNRAARSSRTSSCSRPSSNAFALSRSASSGEWTPYLDDLRDKTLRGLEGRALAGYSTGGLPLGYRSVPVTDPYRQLTGHRIEVDEQGAAVVRRIFALYLEGRSLEAIAHRFNADEVPAPRAKTRHRRKGWVAGTIRAILHNQAYVGLWSFNRRQWVKIPGDEHPAASFERRGGDHSAPV